MQAKVTYEGTAIGTIPLVYRCSKCGKENSAIIELVEKSYFNDAKGAAGTEAYCNLMDKVNECYSVDPIEHMGKIEGKCEDCGNVELWMISPEKAKTKKTLENVLLILIFCGLIAATLIGSIVLNTNPIIPLIFCVVALLIVIGVMNKLTSKRKQEREREFKRKVRATPAENRPRYVLKEQDIIESIKKKMNGEA